MSNLQTDKTKHIEARLAAWKLERGDALRSAAEIAQRDGESTDWNAFRSRLAAILLSQHKYLHPVSGKRDG